MKRIGERAPNKWFSVPNLTYTVDYRDDENIKGRFITIITICEIIKALIKCTVTCTSNQ